MKIAVCVNHVPDTATKIKIADSQLDIDSGGVSYIMAPYDEFAVEEALKIKESSGGTVYAISMGPEANKETIRKALAMGADEGIYLKYEGYSDSFVAARVLADEIKALGAELVFMGKQSTDYDNSVVGQMVAEFLGYNCISTCVAFSLNGNEITAEREIEGGREVYSSALPAVITAQKGLNEPRYPSLKGIMAAKKKPIVEKTVTALQPKVTLKALSKPSAKPPGRIIGTDASAAAELVRVLREEAKVI